MSEFRRRPASASATTSREGGDAGFAKSRHTPTHHPYQPNQRTNDFAEHLGQLDQLYGLMPGGPAKLVVLVEDNGPIHVSKLSSPALAARVDWLTVEWLTVEWLSKLAPELNDSEVV